MESPAVLTGEHFLLGDHAIAEGALAAGCRFFGGYPITPSTETAERMAQRLPQVGGVYMQMEDEIASMAVILGAAWGGAKSMTATSGPGFSLMLENFGLGIITETPTVVVNVQRGAPSTGLPTLVGQGDMMQARWGSHGPYEAIAVAPWNAQECFDLTIKAFNYAERFRQPVMVMADAEIGHLTEKVSIPAAEKIELWNRKKPLQPPSADYKSYEPDPETLVPPMANAGEGYHVFVDSLTHDEKGYPVMNAAAHVKLVNRLCNKITKFANVLEDVEERGIEGADIVVLSYGISARIATRAVHLAKQRGMKVGLLRLKTVWPFPEQRIRALSKKVKGIVVPEINLGQMVREVERVAVDQCRIKLIGHAGGALFHPEEILEGIVAVAEGKAPNRADLAMRGA